MIFKPRTRKLIVLGLTAALVVASLLVLRSGLERWQRDGWVGLAFFSLSMAKGDSGAGQLLTSLVTVEKQGEVFLIHPDSPASRSGIHVGDRILSINGVDVGDPEGLNDLDRTLRRGESVVYVYDQGGVQRRVDVVLESPLASPPHVAGVVIAFLVGWIYLGISLLVFWAKPGSSSAFVFYLMCIVGAASFFSIGVAENDMVGLRGLVSIGGDSSNMAVYLATVAIGVLLANLLLHFSLIFPRRRLWLEGRPEALVWLHTLPFLPVLGFLALVGAVVLGDSVPGWTPLCLVATAAACVWVATRARRDGGLWQTLSRRPLVSQGLALLAAASAEPLIDLVPEPGALFGLLAGLAFIALVVVSLVYSVLTCVVLMSSYRASGVEERYQLRWPVWGTTLSLAATVFVVLLVSALTTFQPQVFEAWPELHIALGQLGKLAYLPIPISFAFGILKYRLLDIDVVLRKALVYAGVTGFVVAGYFLIVGGLGLVVVSLVNVESQVVTVVATLMVAAALVPVRNLLQRWVDRRFYRREAEYPEILAAVRRDTLAAEALGPLAQKLAERVQRGLDVRSVAVFTVAGDMLAARGKIGLRDEVLDLRFDPSKTPFSGSVVDEGEQIVRPPEGEDGAERKAWRQLEAERVVLARLRGETVGFLAVGRRMSREDHGLDEEELMRAVADQLSLAVGELRGRRREGEMRQAFEIQRSLLPSCLPQVPGAELAATWRPAREVSGDYYDVLAFKELATTGVPVGDGLFAVCIGDVSGKGMPAALTMSSLQAAVRATAAPDATPDQVCRRVRRVVASNLSGGKFVTFFYALVDPEAGRLTYTNAGHNAPILMRRDGECERLETGGQALARLFADGELRHGAAVVRPGDRLVLFTDGVSEAQSPEGEQLGEERLVELVREHRAQGVSGLAEVLVEEARRFAAGELSDDLTLVVVAFEA